MKSPVRATTFSAGNTARNENSFSADFSFFYIGNAVCSFILTSIASSTTLPLGKNTLSRRLALTRTPIPAPIQLVEAIAALDASYGNSLELSSWFVHHDFAMYPLMNDSQWSSLPFASSNALMNGFLSATSVFVLPSLAPPPSCIVAVVILNTAVLNLQEESIGTFFVALKLLAVKGCRVLLALPSSVSLPVSLPWKALLDVFDIMTHV